MKKFLCSWSNQGIEEAVVVSSENPKQAYEIFLRKIGVTEEELPVFVYSEGEQAPDEYDDHLKEGDDSPSTLTSSKDPHKPMVTATPGATHSLPTDQKLDRIYDVLNHIRWIMIAFVMITIGIPFILGAILG